MPTVIRVQRGGVQTVRFTARQVRDDALNGRRVRINGATAQILNPDGTTQSNAASLTYEKKGAYLLYWDTTSLAVGDYEAILTFGLGFNAATSTSEKKLPRRYILRLVETL